MEIPHEINGVMVTRVMPDVFCGHHFDIIVLSNLLLNVEFRDVSFNSLMNVEILHDIHHSMFAGATIMESINFTNVERIESEAFNGARIQGSLSFPRATYLCERAFSNAEINAGIFFDKVTTLE